MRPKNGLSTEIFINKFVFDMYSYLNKREYTNHVFLGLFEDFEIVKHSFLLNKGCSLKMVF